MICLRSLSEYIEHSLLFSMFIFDPITGHILNAKVDIPCKKCQEAHYIQPEGNQF